MNGSENSGQRIFISRDSIQHLNLVLALEQKFAVQLSPEEIDKMKSIGAIVTVIEGKLRAAPK
jgi:acyl carrier protein